MASESENISRATASIIIKVFHEVLFSITMTKREILVILYLCSVNSFIIKLSEDFISTVRGDQFTIGCQADKAYEHCKFISPSGRYMYNVLYRVSQKSPHVVGSG